jgi:hypothetical protein
LDGAPRRKRAQVIAGLALQKITAVLASDSQQAGGWVVVKAWHGYLSCLAKGTQRGSFVCLCIFIASPVDLDCAG